MVAVDAKLRKTHLSIKTFTSPTSLALIKVNAVGRNDPPPVISNPVSDKTLFAEVDVYQIRAPALDKFVVTTGRVFPNATSARTVTDLSGQTAVFHVYVVPVRFIMSPSDAAVIAEAKSPEAKFITG